MRRTSTVLAMLTAVFCSACGGTGTESAPADDGSVSLGFVQVGSDGAWHRANTRSIVQAAATAGVALDVRDDGRTQEQQIADLRDLIARGVDVLALSPVVESGWDGVLQQAKDAGIPVILTDRAVDTTDTSLYVSALGSDFTAQGRKAGEWMVGRFRDTTGPVKVVEIEGTTGSAAANGRLAGFHTAIKAAPHLEVIASRDGDFSREGGQKVMAGFLTKYPDIDAVYAHNDEEGIGAVAAIEAAGKKPGKDIALVTVDASRDGLTALAAGKLDFVVECNPLFGPQLLDLVAKAAAGETTPRHVPVTETVFDAEAARKALPTREY
ncbi:ABC transporter substrate-binding protein [Actinoplanes derwentensis]|uniref:Monosaccharide ABC transporter substrate-binding protein, CUT2 family n=1 Tax=Actinoplanes derwentensis TaxID=113562 RepID=A0A1H2DEE0_9ACTN|nr:ABC transporter substrate-binding protein [Actinoplanes derwentensis]GID84783.1 LacI family transcriptional regulator [Actinoplanes derwentensis]SDT81103.1 monosaccharide ABC transporter substrate-binding protein, CUT2 family [Actinoplanes derwentensis]